MSIDDLFASPEARRLLEALLVPKTPAELAALLKDLCTPKEIAELAQRLEVARLLSEGMSYVSVQEQTGASSTTVSRVSKYLNGEAGGYRLVLGKE